MVAGLAYSHCVVVAAVAGTRDRPVIKACGSEARGRVAIVASRVGVDVSGMFARRSRAVMALGAVHRCAFENATDVTSAALDQIVRARQREPCKEMIKILCQLGGGQGHMETDRQHQQTNDRRPDR